MILRYAKLDSEGVVEEIVDEMTQSGNFVKIPHGIGCRVGWIHDGLSFKPPKWTSYQFFLRLTPEERATIRQLSLTDANTADFLMLAQLAQEIHSDDPVTRTGMNYMVYMGVFTEQRKNEILGME